MQDWQKRAFELRFHKKLSWVNIAKEMRDDFPELSEIQTLDKVRRYIRRTDEYKQTKQHNKNEHKISYNKNGQLSSQKFITLKQGEQMTDEFIMEEHGLDPDRWEIVSYTNNFWNTQIKGGELQISYQSKLVAKPNKTKITQGMVSDFFKDLDRKSTVKVAAKPNITAKEMAVVNIADLHLGKLAWKGENSENYDIKIAKTAYLNVLSDIIDMLARRNIDHILFVWCNDFFNIDNIYNSTTAGTPQSVAGRWQEIYNAGLELLYTSVDNLREVAPVKTFYTPSNHDKLSGYLALESLKAWCRGYEDVTVSDDPFPRKYYKWGNTLLGFAHGDKPKGKGTKYKASELAACMPVEAKKLWGETKYREFITGHLHGEHATNEINGVIVRRVSGLTAADSWHTENGYIGAVRKAQTFIYDKEHGLITVHNSPVITQTKEEGTQGVLNI